MLIIKYTVTLFFENRQRSGDIFAIIRYGTNYQRFNRPKAKKCITEGKIIFQKLISVEGAIIRYPRVVVKWNNIEKNLFTRYPKDRRPSSFCYVNLWMKQRDPLSDKTEIMNTDTDKCPIICNLHYKNDGDKTQSPLNKLK